LIFYFDNVNNSHYRLRFIPLETGYFLNTNSKVELIYYEVKNDRNINPTIIKTDDGNDSIDTIIHHD
jgi:hypothetical protein